MRLIQLQELADIWPKVEGWIQEALDYGPGDENALDVLIRLARGDYVLWYDERFCAVVQLVIHPRQKVLTILYGGGEGLKAIHRAFDHGCKWAAENGVDVVRVYGRPGWERALGLERVGVISQIQVGKR